MRNFFFENMDIWKLKIFKSTYFGFAYTNYVTEQWFDNFKIRKFFEVYSLNVPFLGSF